MGSLLTDGVSDDIAQELQMPIGPQAVKRCGETLAISSCNAQRSRHSSSNRAGSAESDTFPESALVQSVRRITRTRLSTSRTVKKSTKCCHNCRVCSLTSATWRTEALCRLRASSWERTYLLEPYTRHWCQSPRRWTCPTWLLEEPSGCVTWSMNAFVYTKTEEMLQLLLDKVAKECRPEGQEWQTLRKVSPTQSHSQQRRRPSPQCMVFLAHIWQFSKAKSRLPM